MDATPTIIISSYAKSPDLSPVSSFSVPTHITLDTRYIFLFFICFNSSTITFEVISRDAGLDVEDLRAAMCDREVWQDVVPGISAEAEG